MGLFSRIRRWQNIAHFSATRLVDYTTLAAIELEVARKSFLRDMVLYAVVGLSNRLPSQALWSESSQGVLDLTMALSMVRSLRMQATNATLGSLPAAFRR